ncbi:hypothetical protein DN752_19140 [Echinicola strongylocentroti]|uniref:Glycosyltransferase RgtA/B/C/D-like domain-containing protein n=1 Tax=Echinicola strongylocentroti TaxID=1795355 RepID=A0A2Z4IMW4_9BACT|nr:hypothetical protein [Echinicola strongylocentroti]AWW32080.1 hypothetical protein DN752_19140 [Echinicola strongylocentroti]
MIQALLLLTLSLLLHYSNHYLGKKHGCTPQQTLHLHILLIYHLGFSYFFYRYVMAFGGDAIVYWNLNGPLANPDANGWWDYFGIGYPFMYWLNYIPSRYFGWDMLSGFFLYSMLSFIGFRWLFLKLTTDHQGMKPFLGLPWPVYILYLPNLHFWTGGIGKEALCFFALVLIMKGISQQKWTGAFIGLVLIFMVRTYFAWLVLISFGGAALLFGPSKKYRLWWGISCSLLALAAFPALLWYVGMEHFSLAAIQQIIQQQFSMLSGKGVGSSVDMADYSFLMRLFTFWFRPLFWDAHNITSFLASIENLILMVGITTMIIKSQWRNWQSLPLFLKFGLLLFFASSLVYMNILSNLGIMMRMKSLFMLFPLLAGAWMVKKEERTKSKE